MSLTSSIDNQFSASTTSPAAGIENGLELLNLAEDGLPGRRIDMADYDSRDGRRSNANTMAQEAVQEEEARPPYLHAMIAGGIGGTTGDMLMHSLDTVKTRQQGDMHIPPKYTTLSNSYLKILRQEGVRKGLYGGWLPALLGSVPGTVIFFGAYEFSKRNMIDFGVQPQLAYLTSGFLADFAASFIYVPSEVLKTRLQLQGRYRNPWFKSGYNYRGTLDAVRTIIRQEGFSALYHGYKATICRDLPFSALQFAFYEQGQSWARQWKKSRDIGLPLELATGAAAGGLAGVITCPLDVVKTRIQTQVNVGDTHGQAQLGPRTSAPLQVPAGHHATPISKAGSSVLPKQQTRSISTSSPSTHMPRPGCVNLDTSSVTTGLKILYQTEGVAGWFRGVGPRFVWTSVQSGCMLFLYQTILRQLGIWAPMDYEEL
jgi:hypothetical protein